MPMMDGCVGKDIYKAVVVCHRESLRDCLMCGRHVRQIENVKTDKRMIYTLYNTYLLFDKYNEVCSYSLWKRTTAATTTADAK
jgi:hypothetical protein